MPSGRISFQEFTMRKFFAAALITVCIVCAFLAAACAPKYYVLNFEQIKGIEFVCEVHDGARVRKGYTVSFTLVINDEDVTIDGDAPDVRANGKRLDCDDAGNYSFKMNSATKVTVDNAIPKLAVRFDTGVTDGEEYIEQGVFYESDDIDVNVAAKVDKGTEISFKVRHSVYCVPVRADEGIIVLANTTIITPDDNGVYKIKVDGDVTVQTRGLQMDEGFAIRENAGSGTPADPYKISRPIDLFYLAALINGTDGGYSYQDKCYVLTNDIDMGGETLYVIGDMVASESAFFCGDFNGNGHTISNYRIRDYIIDQESYVKVFTPYVGLFGYVGATLNTAGNIYNLSVDDYVIDVNAYAATLVGGRDNPDDKSCAIGGIAGYAIGATFTGCSAGGTINVVADDAYPAYVGGIAGYQMSAYSTAVRYYSAVRSCTSSVKINGQSGNVYAAGGITGYLASYEMRTSAFILNSCFTGEVRGAANAGGIAGAVTAYGAISNCYSTGYVGAACRNLLVIGNEQNAYAYAGGIAGYLDTDTAVSNCFVSGKPFAYSVNGSVYALAGDIAAFKATGGEYFVDTRDALEFNNVVAESGGVYDENFFRNTLKWNGLDWTFGEGGYPQVNLTEDNAQTYSYTVTVIPKDNTVGGKSSLEIVATDTYIPMSYWNIVDGGIEEFINADNGKRSYGYFFDEALTMRVPYGYVPMNDITLYAGFADYRDVAGTYYFKNGGTSANIELTADGELIYRDGAFIYSSYYIYNGDCAILFDCPAFAVLTQNGNTTYYAAKAVKVNGNLSLINWNSTPVTGVYTADSPLIATGVVSGFTYGVYYAGSNEYIFYENGTGVTGSGVAFEFVVNPNGTVTATNGVTVTVSGGVVTAVNGTAVRLTDAFAGVWEKSSGTRKQYSFDGKGNWCYEYFGFGENGDKKLLETASGTYNVSGGKATFVHNSKNMTASFDGNGFLIIGDGTYTQTYYRENSFVGDWKFYNNKSTEAISVSLGGISKAGYGYATVSYSSHDYSVTYGAKTVNGTPVLTFYYTDFVFATLKYSAADGTLHGDIYSQRYGAMYSEVFEVLFNGSQGYEITFFRNDELLGVWVSEESGLELVQFNGLGFYDVAGNALHNAVRGTISINGVSAGSYKLENYTLTGSFTYLGVKYEISYDEQSGRIKVSPDGGSAFELQERDGWHTLTLVDGDGNVYSFDGRGELSGGGVLTVLVGGDKSNKQTYTYRVSGNFLNISGAATGTLKPDANEWKLTLGSDVRLLTVNNGFDGNWLIGDNNGAARYMTIGKTGPSLTAAGTVEDTPVTFVYENGLLRFVYGGVTYYIKRTGTELQLGIDKELTIFSHCIPVSSEDGYRGVYLCYGADGSPTGGSLTLDGLAKAEYVNGGTAIMWDRDGVTSTHEYEYKLDGSGHIILTEISLTGERLIYGFIPDENGNYRRDGDSVSYSLVRTDKYYGRYTVAEDDAEKPEGDRVTYAFDGLGTIVASDGSVYTYDIEKVTEKNYIHTFSLSDAQGNKYVAEMKSYGFDSVAQRYVYTLKITAVTE